MEAQDIGEGLVRQVRRCRSLLSRARTIAVGRLWDLFPFTGSYEAIVELPVRHLWPLDVTQQMQNVTTPRKEAGMSGISRAHRAHGCTSWPAEELMRLPLI